MSLTNKKVSCQVCLMDLVNRDKNSGMEAPPVWAEYQAIIDQAEARRCEMTKIERLVSETNSSSDSHLEVG